MNIANVTEFAAFVGNNNLMGLDSSLAQVIQCINNYKSACNCWKREDKQKLYNNCNAIYYNCVKMVIPRLKKEFMSKTTDRQISFYGENSQLIGIVSH